MRKVVVVLLALSATGVAVADSDIHLSASGDGRARLTLQADRSPGTIGLHADFHVDLPVKDSTEAHARSRSFAGEIRVDGKSCGDAHGRVVAEGGRARGGASTGCSVPVGGAHDVVVEAVVTKTAGIERDEVSVVVTADKSTH